MLVDYADKKILLFDGDCNLCNGAVKFILKHEKNNELLFASLQSPIGKELLNFYHIDVSKTDSLIFISNNKAFIKSLAALKISKELKGLYPLLNVFIVIPSFIRDSVYDYVARHRYKWFGKNESCMMPTPETKNRFL